MRVGLGIVIRTKHEHQTPAGGLCSGRDGTQILITRRRSDTVYAGFWELPGGKADRDEGLADCVARELREELGIEVELIQPLATVQHRYEHAYVELSPWLCRLAPGSPEPRNLQVADHRWVTPAELASVTFPEANVSIVREVFELFGDQT